MIKDLKLSLADLVSLPYIQALCRACCFAGWGSYEQLLAIGTEKVSFFPEEFACRQSELLSRTARQITEPLTVSASGCATKAFDKAFDQKNAPLCTLGCFRIGEDGKVHLAAKSEHYQASCGHNFPGYALLEHARKLSISNITHNNTRGHITRLLEEELIRAANGLKAGDINSEDESFTQIRNSHAPHVLNKVINLETGSLVCEAALKMMLHRFYRLHPASPESPCGKKIPVFLVMGSFNGTKEANYHGTTLMTQMLRGMWPDLYDKMEQNKIFKVVPVRINDFEDFRKNVETYQQGEYKIAGFFHELVLMNYGGIRLDKAYITACYQLCHAQDIPVMVDEIQSGMWSEEIFLFREYGCTPDFVSVGKGFPGGMYPASRILTTDVMDTLDQFGALVTNGQEELASLANLITLRFAQHNREHIKEMGCLWERTLADLAEAFPALLDKAEGKGLLGTLFFKDAERAIHFSHILSGEYCIDVSVQAYKGNCPPAALTKLPLIITEEMILFIARCMKEVLRSMDPGECAR